MFYMILYTLVVCVCATVQYTVLQYTVSAIYGNVAQKAGSMENKGFLIES